MKTLVNGLCEFRLLLSFLSEHLARFTCYLGRISGLVILFTLHFHQIFVPSELIGDLIVHEIRKLAGSIQLLASLLLDHLRLLKDLFFFTTLSLFFSVLISKFLLGPRVRIYHQTFNTVWNGVLDSLSSFLPLKT